MFFTGVWGYHGFQEVFGDVLERFGRFSVTFGGSTEVCGMFFWGFR